MTVTKYFTPDLDQAYSEGTFRQAHYMTYVSGFSGTTTRIRLWVPELVSDSSWSWGSLYIGLEGTSDLDFDGDQVEVLQGSTSGGSSGTSGSWTDWVDFEVSDTDVMVVSVYYDGANTWPRILKNFDDVTASTSGATSGPWTSGTDNSATTIWGGSTAYSVYVGCFGYELDVPSSSSPSSSPSEGTPSSTPSASGDATPSGSPSEGTPSSSPVEGTTIFDAGDTIAGTYVTGSVNQRYMLNSGAFTGTASSVILKFYHGGTDYSIKDCYIYKKASSGDNWDGESGTGVQVTKQGSTTFTITSGLGALTDAMDFQIGASDNVVIAINRENAIVPYRNATPANCDIWLKASAGGFEAHLADVTGYGDTANWQYIQEVQDGGQIGGSDGTPSDSPSEGTPSDSPSEGTPSASPSVTPGAYPLYFYPFDSLPFGWTASGAPYYNTGTCVDFEANEWVNTGNRLTVEDEVFVSLKMDDSTYSPGTEDKIIVFRNDSNSEIASVRMDSSGNILGYYGNVSDSATKPTGFQNSYYWVQCTAETTNADGILRVWHNIVNNYNNAHLLIEITNGEIIVG